MARNSGHFEPATLSADPAQSNMAASRKRSERVDYLQLHSFSSAVLYEKNPKIIKSYPKKFQVERIITKRSVANEDEYLIKWQSWPMESTTWEPASHLTPELLRNYEKPSKPADERLCEAGRQFYAGIMAALKGKSLAPIYINMDLDIWRHVSNKKGVNAQHPGHKLYDKEDFSRLSTLPQNWWYYLDEHGEGSAIHFPIKIKPILNWSPAVYVWQQNHLVPGPRMPLEKLCVNVVKRPCNVSNLF